MKREISSSMTAINKFVILAFFGVLLPIVGLVQIFSLNRFSSGILIIILFYASIAFFAVRAALRWKKVEIGESGLFISQINFGKCKEIFVPFSNIKIVRQNFLQMFNPETVTIEFKHPTELGNQVKFIPKVRFFPFFEHSIVGELNSSAKFGYFI